MRAGDGKYYSGHPTFSTKYIMAPQFSPENWMTPESSKLTGMKRNQISAEN
jgi:hypothetical protein